MNFRRNSGQFALYVLSGGTAAVVDFGSYTIQLRLGVWYIAATVLSGVLGFFTTFLMNKYVAFRKKNDFMRHLLRFFIVDMMNILVGALALYALVEGCGMDKQIAKILTMGMVVLWNFFLYKFFVYT
ncbi:MAG: GtrA family protein [Candidatus Peribacteraceae bacterium]|nr:GtrA family protein [Candidatus Peribacteraceae bacterium]MDD5742209.1 GtrA family protein [Candidatus Peribacteraceae bacterium]